MIAASGGRAWANGAMAVVGGAALVYVAARAAVVPLTYDEAGAYSRYVIGPVASVFDFATATNHWLYSILARVSVGLFGDAPWALRAPSVAACAVALVAAWTLARRTEHAAIGVAGFVVVASNPYLLEYFALSRGYGLAVALVLVVCASLVGWLAHPPSHPGADRTVVVGAGAGVLAVAANFASLPVVVAWMGIVSIGTVTASRTTALVNVPRVPWRWLAVWIVLATAMAAAVFSQARLLPSSEFVETIVRVSGLYPEERETIRVFRSDATGRLRDVRVRESGVWRLGRVRESWDVLRVTLPRAVERQVVALDVTSGPATWPRTPASAGPWRVIDVGTTDRVLLSEPPLGWQPDARHHRRVMEHTGVAALGFVALAAVIVALVRVATTTRFVDPTLAWPLAWAVLAIASVGAVPVYLLQRDGELFFGGTAGVVADVLGSLTSGTLYDREPSPRLAASLAGAMLAIGVSVAGWGRARRTPSGRYSLALGGLLAFLVVMTELLHRLTGAPFPLGRTALVWLPPIVMYLIFASEALVTALLVPAKAVAVAALLGSGLWLGHAVRSANLETAFDWPADSATPAALARLAAEWPHGPDSSLRLAVDWDLYPVARYYAARIWPNTAVDVVVLPGDGLPVDYLYARPGGDAPTDRTAPPPATMPVLRRAGVH